MTAADKLVTAQLQAGDKILVGSYTEAGAAAADISAAEAYDRLTRNGYTVDVPVAHSIDALFVANRKRPNATEMVRTATVLSIEATIDTSHRRARRWYTVHTDLGDLLAAPAQTHLKG